MSSITGETYRTKARYIKKGDYVEKFIRTGSLSDWGKVTEIRKTATPGMLVFVTDTFEVSRHKEEIIRTKE